LSTVDVASGEVKGLANAPAAESYPLYSPDGQTIAFAVSDEPPDTVDALLREADASVQSQAIQ